jgi:dTDP-glucose 4,6-dehydratase
VTVLVTGGAGFIGSNFIRYLLDEHADVQVVNLDKLTYAGSLENLAGLDDEPRFKGRYEFVRGDIVEADPLERLFEARVGAVVNFAAETHVDRSLKDAEPFLHTNLLGTHRLLELDEGAPLQPTNPYSASKAAADLLVQSYVRTYRLPAVILRCSNNYGPYQFPEKLIPLMTRNAIESKPLPLYGDGLNVRDWIYVEDHCRAIYRGLLRGRIGEVYNVGGAAQLRNVEVVRKILHLLGKPESLITYVEDRPGHDRRYALDSGKAQRELGWKPCHSFEEGLERTVRWYQSHTAWLERRRGEAGQAGVR